ncbi:uncharacterized protein AMSG_11824 [Thecamonas trahens ATCC 50062]|uniref:Tyrosine-protein kinase ephrin type A/B receptor-like domain-containing protein n=1 Tax=Thecamonas trahens ATCC 50062 TaxID=461836 RepID=A0A0L0D7J5_THETB|nr:hypothetical protein AMSG_11824 [Thecamonas trahens ATCC 50062]KNC48357.1 hypothetical protein AMSG_11824 [Thecamonas trahens ATCC 50062]|eukprot:XP_013758659.1 hypothetical protein AMSG_11824 [Thecamonas trahens ATCC 50062]
MGAALAQRGGVHPLAREEKFRGRVTTIDDDLKMDSNATGEQLGSALAMSRFGGVLAVSAPLYEAAGTCPSSPSDCFRGRVLIYEREGDDYARKVVLEPPEDIAPYGDAYQFGRSLAMHPSGKWLVVGTNLAGMAAFPRGALFVYKAMRTPETLAGFKLESVLQPPILSDAMCGEFARYLIGGANTVIISPDARLVASSAPRLCSNLLGQEVGAVFVFWRTSTSGSFSSDNVHVLYPSNATIDAGAIHGSSSNTVEGVQFGTALAFNSGFAYDYYFADRSSKPTKPQALPSSDAGELDVLQNVVLDNAGQGLAPNLFLAIGAPRGDGGVTCPGNVQTNEGKVYVFALDSTVSVSSPAHFVSTAVLVSPLGGKPDCTVSAASSGEYCGSALAASDDTIFAGCPRDVDFSNVGSVVEYRLEGANPYDAAEAVAVLSGGQSFRNWTAVTHFREPLVANPVVPQRVIDSRFGASLVYAEAMDVLGIGLPTYPSGGDRGELVLLRRNASAESQWLWFAAIEEPLSNDRTLLGAAIVAGGNMLAVGARGVDRFNGGYALLHVDENRGGQDGDEPFCRPACSNGACINLDLDSMRVTVLAAGTEALEVAIPLPPGSGSIAGGVVLFVNGRPGGVVAFNTTVDLPAIHVGGAGVPREVFSEALTAIPTAAETVFTACAPGTVEASGSSFLSRQCSPCLEGTYTETGATSCSVCPAGTTSAEGSAIRAACVCTAGRYTPRPGVSGLACGACPRGARCAGRLAAPEPLDGWWALEYDLFTPCTPSAACVGALEGSNGSYVGPGARCGRGYGGHLCRECQAGYYFDARACERCPPASSALVSLYFVLAVLMGLAVLATAIYGSQAAMFESRATGDAQSSRLGNFAFVHVSLAIATLQIMTVLLGMDFSWPVGTSSVGSVLSSMLMFSSRTFATGCSVTDFGARYVLAICFPLVVVLVFCSVFVLLRLVRPTKQYSLLLLVRAAVIMIPPLYIPASKAALELFDCSALPNGRFYLDAAPEVECYVGGWWVLFPLGLVTSVAYVCAPLGMGFALYQARHDLDSPRNVALYGSLFARYRAGTYFWEMGLMAKRFGVVVFDLFMTQHAYFQLALVFALLLTSLCMHLHASPYRSRTHNVFSNVFEALLVAMAKEPSSEARAVATGSAWAVIGSVLAICVLAIFWELWQLSVAWRAGKLDHRVAFYDDMDHLVVDGGEPDVHRDGDGIALEAGEW